MEKMKEKKESLSVRWLQFKREFAKIGYILKMGLTTGCFFSMGFYMFLGPPSGNTLHAIIGVCMLFVGGALIVGTAGMLKGIRLKDLEHLEMECTNKF
jgi:multisubunit Na+/H+ antiporter MnhC subunit